MRVFVITRESLKNYELLFKYALTVITMVVDGHHDHNYEVRHN
jgi:hypothetical protein